MKIRRPSGGQYWHAVPDGQRKALCGFVPSSPKNSLFAYGRGRWIASREGEPTCPRCLERLDTTTGDQR